MVHRASPPSPGPSGRAVALATAALGAVAGCAALPEGRPAVDAVRLAGASALPASDLLERLATEPSPKFLGLFRGVVFDYAAFDETLAVRDLARIERYYRARGYYDAYGRVVRVTPSSAGHVHVTFVVDEGEPVRVGTVAVDGLEGVSPAVAAEARSAAAKGLEPGALFDEATFARASDALARALSDGGHAAVATDRHAAVDVAAHRADVTFTVHPGPVAFLGPVYIEGLGDLPEDRVRQALGLRPGARFSASALARAQEGVLDLGVFNAVEVTADVTAVKAGGTVAPVRVRVEPARLRTVKLGGGMVLDVIKTDGHLTGTWEDRNFLGGLRRFTVEERPAVVLYPTRLPTLNAPERLLPSNKVSTELRQPGFLEAHTGGTLRLANEVYPVLLRSSYTQGEPVLGYVHSMVVAAVDRPLVRNVFASLSQTVQVDIPFYYYYEAQPGSAGGSLSNVVLSYPTFHVEWDLRDNRFQPRSGAFFAFDLSNAGLGGDGHDLKIQPEARGYVPLGRRVTVALRAATGFLKTFNYAENGVYGIPSHDDLQFQILYFRGLFSGGPNSNRGYPLRGVGPRGPLSFYNAGLASSQIAKDCDPAQSTPGAPNPACTVPLGGLSLWEASAEVRVEAAGPLRVVGFCDASDVSPDAWNLRFNSPHLSCGGGVRYDTPVGPLRIDVGVRIPGAQAIPKPTDSHFVTEQAAAETLPGVPITIHFALGEAY